MLLAWPALELLAEALTALALAILRVAIVGAIFYPLIATSGHIPFVGPWISNALKTIEQEIASKLGEAESKVDSALGNSFHRLAKAADSLWSLIKANARWIGVVSPMLAELVYLLTHLRTQVKQNTTTVRHLGTRVHALEQGVSNSKTAHVPARVKTLEREYLGLEHGIRSLTRELHGIDDITIPSLRQAVNEADSVATQAFAKANAIPYPTSAKTWAEAVALALPALGVNWIRCGPLGNLFNSRGCGIGQLLEDILGGIFDVFLLADFCALLPEVEKLFAEFSAPVVSLISTAANSVCAVANPQWSTFHIDPGPLPPPQTLDKSFG